MLEENKTVELKEEDLKNISGGMISFEPLRELMKQRGISTYTLQEKYGFNPADVSRLKYNHDYTMKMVKRLCEIFNCEPSDIIKIVEDDKA